MFVLIIFFILKEHIDFTYLTLISLKINYFKIQNILNIKFLCVYPSIRHISYFLDMLFSNGHIKRNLSPYT